MRNTKRAVQVAVELLAPMIEETIELQLQLEHLAQRFKTNWDQIKATMIEQKLPRMPTANGCEALIVDEDRLAWNVERLEDELTEEEFEKLCPRKPEGKELRALLDSETHQGLKRCAKVTHTQRLELRQPIVKVKAPPEPPKAA